MPLNTPSSWLDHNILKIIKGVGKTPTDANSAEPDPVVVNLLGGIITLETGGWSPQIATLKSDGVWADSPITDGRTLIAAPSSNVTEKMTVIIADKSYLSVIQAFSGLNQMVNDCRDFWQSGYQVDPVYLTWFASCGKGEQYALLYNINVSPEYLDSPMPSMRVALTLEREPYWRGIPPGANPKLWTFYVNNQQIGLAGKVLADATLVSGTDHLINATIQNKFEWLAAAAGAQVTPVTQNYIDITASQVPGDAPALVEMDVSGGKSVGINSLYVALSTRKQSQVNHLGATRANSYIFAAGDAAVSGGAAKNIVTSANGLLSNNSNVNYTNVSKALALGDTTYTAYLLWYQTILMQDNHFLAGTFAVMLRAAATTEDTTQKAQIIFTETDDNIGYNQTQTLTDISLQTPGTGVYFLHYCGTVTFPLSGRENVSLLGYGTQVRETKSNLEIEIDLKNSSGAARTVTILDLILIPIEHFMTQVVSGTEANSTPSHTIIDNTGYMAHGRNELVGKVYTSNNLSGGIASEVRGATPYLLPKTNQRLHFLSTIGSAKEGSQPDDVLTVRMNIVPRWAGIRDS